MRYLDETDQVVIDGFKKVGETDYILLVDIDKDVTVLPPDPQPPPIFVVSPRQIRQALTSIGLRAQVETAVLAGTQDLQDWWNYATQFEQNHPMVVGMSQQLGVSDVQLQQLYELAASL
jgi:hypothetical protein